MTTPPLTDDQLLEAVAALNKHGNQTSAARSIGMSRSAFQNRLFHAKERGLYDLQGPKHIVLRPEDRIDSLEAAWERSGLSPDTHYVSKVTVNGYDVTSKVLEGGEEVLATQQNQQIKVEFKTSVPPETANVMETMAAKVRPAKAFKAPKKPKRDPHMLEISLFDAHFGKMAWRLETGQDYDLKIAEKLYSEAVEDLLTYTSPYSVDKIVFPIGQDFFHIDNEKGVTPRGGNVLDRDGRLAKIIEVGCESVVAAVERCLQVAPVEIMWVPGNHDYVNSLWLIKYMEAYFRNTKHFTSDVGQNDQYSPRKALVYGRTLLAYTHGDQEKHTALPSIIMAEHRDKMAEVDHIEIHTGHFHKAKSTDFVSVDTMPGDVRLRVLPSLSGRDAWHAMKGYGTIQAAEAYLWSRQGYAGHFSVRPR